MNHMAVDRLYSIEKNLWAVPEFGRFDDLLCLLDTPARHAVIKYIKTQFNTDMKELERGEKISLLGKWLPSINAHNTDTICYAKIIAKSLGLIHEEYRKSLSKLRGKITIIENNLRECDYGFDYGKQPSKAMMKYRKVFLRNDRDRYKEFLSRVEGGEVTMNTKTLLPYEIIRPIVSGNEISFDERHSLDVTWRAQADFTDRENALVVIDGSGSMYTGQNLRPADVALSLGIYFAQRNTGMFHNHFITFSERPQLVEIKGRDICDKVRYAATFNEIANTNIQKVFELILQTGVKNKLPQRELPSTVYIISDMEFDVCTNDAGVTNFTRAKTLFGARGYKLPKLVFWNVASHNQQQPVTMNEKGVVLVSGANPQVFSMIATGNVSPYSFMLDTLGAERYSKVLA